MTKERVYVVIKFGVFVISLFSCPRARLSQNSDLFEWPVRRIDAISSVELSIACDVNAAPKSTMSLCTIWRIIFAN